MEKKVGKFIYWAPRILAIIFLLFLAMFSLDVFEEGYNSWETIVGLFMHNIPVFVLAIILWISWKHEIVGGIGFILAGLAYIFIIARGGFDATILTLSLIIAGPAIITGVLFLVNWKKKEA